MRRIDRVKSFFGYCLEMQKREAKKRECAMGEKYNESTGYRLNPMSKRWEKVNKDDGHGSKTGGSAKDAMSDYATGGKDYTAEEAERFIDSVFYDLNEEIESGIHDDLVDTEIMIDYGDNSPFYDWEYPETGIYEQPYFDEAVASFCRDRGPVSEKEKRMLLESDNIVARIIGENMEVNSESSFTTADFQINDGVITGLSSEGRTKIRDNDGVIDSFPDGVTAIGNGAFSNTGITAIQDWGEINSIGDSAFSENQITELPDNWGEIATVGICAFYNNQITVLPDNWGEITSIGNYTFYYNRITALPDNWGEITSIGDSAFHSNQIKELPDNLGKITSIGDYAFSHNQITTPTDNQGDIINISEFIVRDNQIKELPDNWGNITNIGDSAFRSNQTTTLTDNRDEITSIGDSEFRSNRITEIPESWGEITSINDRTFFDNQNSELPDD